MSGYPSRSESPHDLVENSHASTALSYADGLAKAYTLTGQDRHVVAVVGDGALTGGMSWEALNNIAACPTSKLVVVVNDNGRSYTPTVGGLAHHLATLRTSPRYEEALDTVRSRLKSTKVVGPPVYDALHAIKKGLKDALAPQGLFEDLGLKYIGPVDGHDRAAVEQALTLAKNFGGPVLVHALTTRATATHRPRTMSRTTSMLRAPSTPRRASSSQPPRLSGQTSSAGSSSSWVRSVRTSSRSPPPCSIPTGLDAFAAAYPDRTFDVGIAEQHAITSAVGMAMAGLHPVVAVYATFLNRAFDQVLMDAALHRQGITIVLDRAGVTGEDGASHNGMWDMSILQVVPGLRLAAPRDGARVKELLREAVDVDDAPTVLRIPKGAVCRDLEAVATVGAVDVMVKVGEPDVLLVAVGAMVETCVEVAARLQAQGIGVTVVDPRWVKPLPVELVDLAGSHRLVVSVEDNGRVGAAAACWPRPSSTRDWTCPSGCSAYRSVPRPRQAGGPARDIGLDPQSLAREITAHVSALDGSEAPSTPSSTADSA
jgi:1-deoxy-D-xylulose-5-phosphate synthase